MYRFEGELLNGRLLRGLSDDLQLLVRARQDLEPLAASFSEPRRFPWTAGRSPRVARIRARGDVTKVATTKFSGIAA